MQRKSVMSCLKYINAKQMKQGNDLDLTKGYLKYVLLACTVAIFVLIATV